MLCSAALRLQSWCYAGSVLEVLRLALPSAVDLVPSGPRTPVGPWCCMSLDEDPVTFVSFGILHDVGLVLDDVLEVLPSVPSSQVPVP